MPDQSTVKNLLLRAMSSTDFARLNPGLVRVDFVRPQELVHPDVPIEHCWFIEDGIASIVAMSRDGRETEAGIVGRDGMIDVATILGVDTSSNRCFIQISGHGYRLPAELLADCLEASVQLRSLLNRYAHRLLAQVASTAHANASFTVEERLARWLLMCGDRLGGDDIFLTHELLSIMLNVRRAGVTTAIHALENAGLIKASRGVVSITNRPALIRLVPDGYTLVAPY